LQLDPFVYNANLILFHVERIVKYSFFY
jgi:hypothetical protein